MFPVLSLKLTPSILCRCLASGTGHFTTQNFFRSLSMACGSLVSLAGYFIPAQLGRLQRRQLNIQGPIVLGSPVIIVTSATALLVCCILRILPALSISLAFWPWSNVLPTSHEQMRNCKLIMSCMSLQISIRLLHRWKCSTTGNPLSESTGSHPTASFDSL
ncbi:hypothetical protein K438DRAFT_645690 [Mycena galopus ATCC 62051]|nr:hypothetical protein K438DRAFT_645690 [Mycena galopus ATCC 62051]